VEWLQQAIERLQEPEGQAKPITVPCGVAVNRFKVNDPRFHMLLKQEEKEYEELQRNSQDGKPEPEEFWRPGAKRDWWKQELRKIRLLYIRRSARIQEANNALMVVNSCPGQRELFERCDQLMFLILLINYIVTESSNIWNRLKLWIAENREQLQLESTPVLPDERSAASDMGTLKVRRQKLEQAFRTLKSEQVFLNVRSMMGHQTYKLGREGNTVVIRPSEVVKEEDANIQYYISWLGMVCDDLVEHMNAVHSYMRYIQSQEGSECSLEDQQKNKSQSLSENELPAIPNSPLPYSGSQSPTDNILQTTPQSTPPECTDDMTEEHANILCEAVLHAQQSSAPEENECPAIIKKIPPPSGIQQESGSQSPGHSTLPATPQRTPPEYADEMSKNHANTLHEAVLQAQQPSAPEIGQEKKLKDYSPAEKESMNRSERRQAKRQRKQDKKVLKKAENTRQKATNNKDLMAQTEQQNAEGVEAAEVAEAAEKEFDIEYSKQQTTRKEQTYVETKLTSIVIVDFLPGSIPTEDQLHEFALYFLRQAAAYRTAQQKDQRKKTQVFPITPKRPTEDLPETTLKTVQKKYQSGNPVRDYIQFYLYQQAPTREIKETWAELMARILESITGHEMSQHEALDLVCAAVAKAAKQHKSQDLSEFLHMIHAITAEPGFLDVLQGISSDEVSEIAQQAQPEHQPDIPTEDALHPQSLTALTMLASANGVQVPPYSQLHNNPWGMEIQMLIDIFHPDRGAGKRTMEERNLTEPSKNIAASGTPKLTHRQLSASSASKNLSDVPVMSLPDPNALWSESLPDNLSTEPSKRPPLDNRLLESSLPNTSLRSSPVDSKQETLPENLSTEQSKPPALENNLAGNSLPNTNLPSSPVDVKQQTPDALPATRKSSIVRKEFGSWLTGVAPMNTQEYEAVLRRANEPPALPNDITQPSQGQLSILYKPKTPLVTEERTSEGQLEDQPQTMPETSSQDQVPEPPNTPFVVDLEISEDEIDSQPQTTPETSSQDQLSILYKPATPVLTEDGAAEGQLENQPQTTLETSSQDNIPEPPKDPLVAELETSEDWLDSQLETVPETPSQQQTLRLTKTQKKKKRAAERKKQLAAEKGQPKDEPQSLPKTPPQDQVLESPEHAFKKELDIELVALEKQLEHLSKTSPTKSSSKLEQKVWEMECLELEQKLLKIKLVVEPETTLASVEESQMAKTKLQMVAEKKRNIMQRMETSEVQQNIKPATKPLSEEEVCQTTKTKLQMIAEKTLKTVQQQSVKQVPQFLVDRLLHPAEKATEKRKAAEAPTVTTYPTPSGADKGQAKDTSNPAPKIEAASEVAETPKPALKVEPAPQVSQAPKSEASKPSRKMNSPKDMVVPAVKIEAVLAPKTTDAPKPSPQIDSPKVEATSTCNVQPVTAQKIAESKAIFGGEISLDLKLGLILRKTSKVEIPDDELDHLLQMLKAQLQELLEELESKSQNTETPQVALNNQPHSVTKLDTTKITKEQLNNLLQSLNMSPEELAAELAKTRLKREIETSKALLGDQPQTGTKASPQDPKSQSKKTKRKGRKAKAKQQMGNKLMATLKNLVNQATEPRKAPEHLAKGSLAKTPPAESSIRNEVLPNASSENTRPSPGETAKTPDIQDESLPVPSEDNALKKPDIVPDRQVRPPPGLPLPGLPPQVSFPEDGAQTPILDVQKELLEVLLDDNVLKQSNIVRESQFIPQSGLQPRNEVYYPYGPQTAPIAPMAQMGGMSQMAPMAPTTAMIPMDPMGRMTPIAPMDSMATMSPVPYNPPGNFPNWPSTLPPGLPLPPGLFPVEYLPVDPFARTAQQLEAEALQYDYAPPGIHSPAPDSHHPDLVRRFFSEHEDAVPEYGETESKSCCESCNHETYEHAGAGAQNFFCRFGNCECSLAGRKCNSRLCQMEGCRNSDRR
jgi:hypothetical protein